MMKFRSIPVILLAASSVVLITACNLPLGGLLQTATSDDAGQPVLDAAIVLTLTAPANLTTPGESDPLPDATGTATTVTYNVERHPVISSYRRH